MSEIIQKNMNNQIDNDFLDIPAIKNDEYSALSDSVQNLIQIFHTSYSSLHHSIHSDYFCLDVNNRLIIWKNLDLPSISELYRYECSGYNSNVFNAKPNGKFKEAIISIAKIAYQIHNDLASASVEQMLKWYVPCTLWLGNQFVKTFKELILLLKSVDDTDCLLGVSLLTAATERVLIDIIGSAAPTTERPRFLRDLLRSSQLTELFEPTAISCFYLLIGSPQGLNLRNLTWHGFIRPKEIPKQCLTLLIVMTASLKGALKDQQFVIEHLPLIDLHQMKVDYGFPVVTSQDCISLKKLFQLTSIIPRSRVQIWVTSINHFLSERYLDCLTLLLPQFEHSLRILFAGVNHCQHRIITAENSMLFTTLTEILAAKLPTGGINCLCQELSDNYLVLLMDLLMYPEGLRLRDRISHADVVPESLTKDTASVVLIAVFLICYKYCATCGPDEVYVEKFVSIYNTYESKHHPYLLIKEEIKGIVARMKLAHSLTLKVESYNNYNVAIVNEAERINFNKFDDGHNNLKMSFLHQLCHSINLCIDKDKSMLSEIFDRLLDQTAYQLSKSPPNPLFRSRQEQQIAKLLRAITMQTRSIINNVLSAHSAMSTLWSTGQMRSRKRINFQKFCEYLPVILCYVCVILLYVSTEWNQLNFTANRFEKLCIQLKAILCICENTASSTEYKKSQWDRALHVLSKLIHQFKY
ncbi:Endoplasmic reticulum membrane-associated RNA degradation protein [Trichoplax sp. H2]|nr:Endoplasmic reticulum membrane-associated RNA degradation protein [Trichoplax sp. H2]|eukprot:RDD47468.1 Endoplasmic reticulum membrane-associated RNA degradation protein [Trichoplax sp. H2]